MDGRDLEPGDGVYQDHGWLRQLLRRAVFGTLSRRAEPPVRERLRFDIAGCEVEAAAEWRASRRIFVNAMSDIFHKEVPRAFIDQVFDTMEKASWHTFQVLTKRSSLLTRYLAQRYPARLAPSHIWLGVSVEDAQNAVRIKHLRAARASVKFVSFEPLIGPVGKVDLTGIDWAIVGGESGPRARVMAEEWALELHDQSAPRTSPFSTNNGAAFAPRPVAARSGVGSGINIRNCPKRNARRLSPRNRARHERAGQSLFICGGDTLAGATILLAFG